MPNPYFPLLDRLTEILMSRDAVATAQEQCRGDFVHWDADNEWANTNLAGFLMAAAAAWSLPGNRWHHSEPLAGYIRTLFAELVARGHGDRWWHQDGRKGDPNIDRFTLLPLMEAFLLAGETLPEDLAARVRERIEGVLALQLAEFGREGDHPPYPNMDVYTCLIMLHGHRLTGREPCRRGRIRDCGRIAGSYPAQAPAMGPETGGTAARVRPLREADTYWQEFDRLLGVMQDAQFADGGWTYLAGTNECPVYHDINVMLMARIHQLTGDPRALEQIRRAVPYYPQVVDPCGRPEYFTDPWWKHSWHEQFPWPPDTIASLTGDAANRAIGDQLRGPIAGRLAELGGQVDLPEMVWAAMLWEDVGAVVGRGLVPRPEWHKPNGGAGYEPPPYNGTTCDANTEGPRGRFERWSWAATARYASDTLVGAVLHTPADEPVQALMAVIAEVLYCPDGVPDTSLQRQALGLTPEGTRGETTITGDAATFAAEYLLAAYRAVWGAEPFPERWLCRQAWRLTPDLLAGRIEFIPEQDSPYPPQVRVRFGRNLEMRDEGSGRYACGPFGLAVTSDDFTDRRVVAAPSVAYLTPLDAVELHLRAGSGPYRSGKSYALQLEIRLLP